jgi:hypothetical protein
MPQNQKKSQGKYQQEGNPHDDPDNLVPGRRWRRGQKLMVRPNGMVFIWIGWQYVSLCHI